MRNTGMLVAFVLGCFVFASAQMPSAAQRDKAIEGVNACIKRNEVASRECRKLNDNIDTLVQVYKSGDKSVLPLLFKFTYLTDFYDYALLSDPSGFLSEVKLLGDNEKRAVAVGIAGGVYGTLTQTRFEELRGVLRTIPADSPNGEVARQVLEAVDTNNASRFLNYFPVGTFTSRAGDFQVHWYSRDMYSLGERPLIPVSNPDDVTYRFTYLGAFTGPKCLKLSLLPDGSGTLQVTTLKRETGKPVSERKSVSAEQVAKFLNKLQEAQFWQMPAEGKSRGFDGAEWILEGVQKGEYHIAVRWCPGSYPKHEAAQDRVFAEAARVLFEFAGIKNTGC
jgi:hypothetical protein